MWLGSTRDTAAALGDMPASVGPGKWCFAGQKMSPPELRDRGAGGVATKYGGPLAVSIQYPPRPVAAFRLALSSRSACHRSALEDSVSTMSGSACDRAVQVSPSVL